MAYRLKPAESVSHGLKRVSKKELRSALRALQQSGRIDRDEAVHDGRKRIKKVRAILDLMRAHLGRDYRKGKQQLRQAARPLSTERDAHVLLETFDDLRRRHRAGLRPSAWTGIRRAVEKSATRTSRRARRPALVDRTLKALRIVREQTRSWSVGAKGFRALRPGLKRAFTRARKEGRRVRRRADASSLHRWRKRVKTHWYQMRLLEAIQPQRMRPYVTALHRLESSLGDHHNLAVLQTRLRVLRLPGAMQGDVTRLGEIITRTEERLQVKVLALGGRIYGENGHAFLRRLERLWDAWRRATRRNRPPVGRTAD